MTNESINENWAKSINKEDFISHMVQNGTSYSDTDLEAYYNTVVPAKVLAPKKETSKTIPPANAEGANN